MSNPVKEKISTDLKQAKEVGQLRTDRIREIVQAAVSQVASELKTGSSELRSLVRDAFTSAISGIQESGEHLKDDVTASIEGVIDGISRAQQTKISETEAEVKRLQAQLDQEEDQLDKDVEEGLAGLKEASQDMSAEVREQIEQAIDTLRNSEEVSLLKKRYAQLQTQAAILRANLAARSESYYDRAQDHLEDAKTWYQQARPKAEAAKEHTDQKFTELEDRLGEAGSALAKKERQVRSLLRDLLKQATDSLRDGDKETVKRPLADLPPARQIEIDLDET